MSLPNVTTQLVGRDEDIAAVRAFVDQAAAHGGALVITGDAGVGKSALIEAAGSYGISAGLRGTGMSSELEAGAGPSTGSDKVSFLRTGSIRELSGVAGCGGGGNSGLAGCSEWAAGRGSAGGVCMSGVHAGTKAMHRPTPIIEPHGDRIIRDLIPLQRQACQGWRSGER